MANAGKCDFQLLEDGEPVVGSDESQQDLEKGLTDLIQDLSKVRAVFEGLKLDEYVKEFGDFQDEVVSNEPDTEAEIDEILKEIETSLEYLGRDITQLNKETEHDKAYLEYQKLND